MTRPNRNARRQMAEETVALVERGRYVTAAGGDVDIADAVRTCLDGTRYFPPEAIAARLADVLAQPSPGHATSIDVTNETALAGVAHLLARSPAPVAALNFASARHPGGGFLSGSEAQEESLARSSALYASLLRAADFHARHRAGESLLYSDAMVLSPGCPVFRDDAGDLLAIPHPVTFITSAAPNAGAIATQRPEEAALVEATLRRRAAGVLALAATHGVTRLVLGAWGCGVFRNDPSLVATAFADALRGPFRGWFEDVRFSVLDGAADAATYAAFARVFG